MTTCPKCAPQRIVTSGKVGGTQRWLCRGCGYQFTRTMPRGRPPWQKSLAVFLYGHGSSMHARGGRFGGRASSGLKWIRRSATAHDVQPSPRGKAVGMELEDMGFFLQTNVATSGSGTLWIVLQASSWTGRVGIVLKQPRRSWLIGQRLGT